MPSLWFDLGLTDRGRGGVGLVWGSSQSSQSFAVLIGLKPLKLNQFDTFDTGGHVAVVPVPVV